MAAAARPINPPFLWFEFLDLQKSCANNTNTFAIRSLSPLSCKLLINDVISKAAYIDVIISE